MWQSFSRYLCRAEFLGHRISYIFNCNIYLAIAKLLSDVGFPGGSDGKESSCNAGDLGWSLGWEDPLEEGMATHSSVLV